MMQNMTRRSFVGAAAAAAAMAGVSVASAEPQKIAPQAEFADVEPKVEGDVDMYRVTTGVDELNRIRREQIDACEDLTLEDGTVIPAIWVKCRAMMDGLGCGVQGYLEPTEQCFGLYKVLCNNDEKIAEIWVNSPLGVRFTAFDASVSTGYSVEECAEALEVLAQHGAVCIGYHAGERTYWLQKITLGITESAMPLYKQEGFFDNFLTVGYGSGDMPIGPLMTIPVDKSLVADSVVYPYDDVEALLERHEVFGVSACQCRYCTPAIQPREELPDPRDLDTVKDFITADGHHLERCISFGENAEYLIEIGVARQLTRDETRDILMRSIDEGSILNVAPTKTIELLCCCDAGCDYVPSNAQYFAPDSLKNAFQSHYELMYDKDLCIKCGTCVGRCVPHSIEIDEDGYPAVTGYCFRCGQCGLGCPVGARTLKEKDRELWPHLADDMLDMVNLESAYRYEKGMWPYEA